MDKRILLIGGNYFPEPTGIGKYNSEMMDWLANKGNDCTVITSYPYYPYWKIQKPYSKFFLWYTKETIKPLESSNIPITIYRCPQYVPTKPTIIKRMLLDVTFSFSCFLLISYFLFKKKRYTHIICVAPSFQIGLLAILYKKIRGTKFLYHIQDLQIEAAKGLDMVKSSKVIKYLLKIEKFILSQADIISSISEGMIEKIKIKCNKNVVFFPNWVDNNLFFPIDSKQILKKEFGFNTDDKIILYSGAIGEKQGLDSVIRAAKMLSHFNNLKFVICGEGPYRTSLEKLTIFLNVTNVTFLPLQPIERMNKFLNMADIHLVLLKANTSNLVMPSKLTSILSIGGLAIISAPKNSSLFHLVSKNKLGLLITPENDLELISAIVEVIEKDTSINDNARNYATQHFSINNVLSSYSEILVGS
jgi:colanic acid biosynthesis glycosyl transferase WcaI